MAIRTRLVPVLTWIALVAVASAPAAAYTGVVSVDSVEAEAGQQVVVPIRLHTSDEPITGLAVPLHFSSPDMLIDSVSFEGSMMPANFTGLVSPPGAIGDSVEVILLANWESPTPTMTATDGLVAALHITVLPSANPGFIPIDSVCIDTVISDGGPVVHYWKKVNAADSLANTLLPDFVPGGVEVKTPTDVGDGLGLSNLPQEFALAQNYPNPFNPVTSVEFSVPRASVVRLEVFNILGQSVAVPVEGWRSPGLHQVSFDASNLPSGVYFYRLTFPGGTQTKKMTLVK